MADFFHHFGLQPGFLIDESELRKEYLRLQKLWHPDFFASDPVEMEKALQFTALNNEAYKTLSTLNNRILYILQTHGMWKEGEKTNLPQDFLMEMLDLNDLIEEAKTNPEAREEADKQLTQLKQEVNQNLQAKAQLADAQKTNWNPQTLEPIRTEFEKLRYIQRLAGSRE